MQIIADMTAIFSLFVCIFIDSFIHLLYNLLFNKKRKDAG